MRRSVAAKRRSPPGVGLLLTRGLAARPCQWSGERFGRQMSRRSSRSTLPALECPRRGACRRCRLSSDLFSTRRSGDRARGPSRTLPSDPTALDDRPWTDPGNGRARRVVHFTRTEAVCCVLCTRRRFQRCALHSIAYGAVLTSDSCATVQDPRRPAVRGTGRGGVARDAAPLATSRGARYAAARRRVEAEHGSVVHHFGCARLLDACTLLSDTSAVFVPALAVDRPRCGSGRPPIPQTLEDSASTG